MAELNRMNLSGSAKPRNSSSSNNKSTAHSHTSNNHVSSTADKRAAYNYRREYFKRNPGFLGLPIWRCAYCGKILIGRKSVEVDHIVSLKTGGINRTFNCVAACRRCNRSKGAKADLRIGIGLANKFIDTAFFTVQKVVWKTLKTVVGTALRVVTQPARNITGLQGFIVVFIMAVIVFIVFKFILGGY